MNESERAALKRRLAQTSSKEVCLWHTADSIFSFESFLNNGAQPTGNGYGGQSKGFYVWNQKKYAVSHFADFLAEGLNAETLLVGVKVDRKDIKYPDWQFDLEVSKEINPLLFKYQDRVAEIKGLKCTDAEGKEYVVDMIEKNPYTTKDHCLFTFKAGNLGCTFGFGDGAEKLYVAQAIIDKMCEDKDFRDDYNRLLRASVNGPNRSALKYCGKDALFINEVSYIQKKEHTQPVEHVIYRAEKASDKPQAQKLCEDLLQTKMEIIRETIGDKMGKTADIKTGKVRDEHKDVAEDQIIISKILMKARRKMDGK